MGLKPGSDFGVSNWFDPAREIWAILNNSAPAARVVGQKTLGNQETEDCMNTKALYAIFLAWAVLLSPANGQPADQIVGVYNNSGYSAMMRLGKDIYTFMKPQYKSFVSSQPISIETDVTPFVRLLFYPDDPKPIRGVWISVGFLDLVNHVAHAKAIDRIQKGYFNRYIDILSKETGAMSLSPLPDDTNPAFWSEGIMNEQLSNFNSIVGIVVGIKLAHHYQGHYDKYKAQLEDANGKVTPINNLITPKEWDEAFAAGVRNALDAGCMIEGAIPFFETFDKMKVRPAWAVYFMPDSAKFSRMRKEMEKIQKKFFNGEE